MVKKTNLSPSIFSLSLLHYLLLDSIHHSNGLNFLFHRQSFSVHGRQQGLVASTTKNMMTTKSDTDVVLDDETMHIGFKTTLAESFVIYMNDDKRQTQNEPLIWSLLPLQDVVNTSGGEANTDTTGVGTAAIRALKSSPDIISPNTQMLKLVCNCIKTDNNEYDTLEVTVENLRNQVNHLGKQCDEFIDLISIVMVQDKLKNLDPIPCKIRISLPSSSSSSSCSGVTETTFNSSDLLTPNGCKMSLFQSFLPPGLNDIEMSDMVDCSGTILGSLPRLLVHKYNFLHRGVGIIIYDNKHLKKNDAFDTFDIYCHQRTATKRIFPSLYDMFVGGVSISGEDSKLTAAREVAEELGLDKALQYIETSNEKSKRLTFPLSEELFQCTICTSYNRCIVTVFTYEYRCDEEIKWQAEEVAWGDFVPYEKVKKAASMSISRLVNANVWSGTADGWAFPLEKEDIHDESVNNNDWEDWDFVPDGLLVWIEWLQWMKRQKDEAVDFYENVK